MPTPPTPPKAGWSVDEGMLRVASVEQQTRFRPREVLDAGLNATWFGLTSTVLPARERTKSSDQVLSAG